MDSNTVIITWAFGILGSILSGICLYKIKHQAEKNDMFARSITALENTAVSDTHVRQVIREEMASVNLILPKLMDSMHKIELYIAKEEGYRTAKADAARRKGDLHGSGEG